jgi:predicted ATPase with chaperone activity
MEAAFSDVVLKEHLLDQLGPALHSGRPIFLYGPPGAGKTYVAKMLSRLMNDDVLIPYAIAQGEQIVQFFDPVYHQRVDADGGTAGVMLEQGYDTRFIRCKRPVAITGGELTLDMLEMAYDPSTRQYQAPLQLKANNGLYMIDDLGRQRADVTDLLNRWIVPMEESQDYLSLRSGEHFSIPFDVVLIFSTNLDPLQLADEAFLRRLGYKIRFDYLNAGEFDRIWAQVCAQRGIEVDASILQFVKDELYGRCATPMLPCHPRDLIGLALDQACYQGRDAVMTVEDIKSAWNSYFVRLQDGNESEALQNT